MRYVVVMATFSPPEALASSLNDVDDVRSSSVDAPRLMMTVEVIGNRAKHVGDSAPSSLCSAPATLFTLRNSGSNCRNKDARREQTGGSRDSPVSAGSISGDLHRPCRRRAS